MSKDKIRIVTRYDPAKDKPRLERIALLLLGKGEHIKSPEKESDTASVSEENDSS